jgi:DNA topoisomerase-1
MPSALSRARSALVRTLASERGLTIVEIDALTYRRVRHGAGFAYRDGNGKAIRNGAELARLKSLAMPPAYADVRYAAEARAHLQAVGTDAAGRLQYRYHPQWTEVREAIKARRLARLVHALPGIKRAIAKELGGCDCTADFAAAAVVHLVDLAALRAGSESYARDHGTRGASTLLKSNVRVQGRSVRLQFKAKGGKAVTRQVTDARLAAALAKLQALPGRRLFQHLGTDGQVHVMRASDVNAFLRKVPGLRISLKDFRTLVGSRGVLEALAGMPAGTSQRARRSQLRSAVVEVAEQLANTPAVCRKSYVQAAVVNAFEAGELSRMARPPRSALKQAELVARLVGRRARKPRTRPVKRADNPVAPPPRAA